MTQTRPPPAEADGTLAELSALLVSDDPLDALLVRIGELAGKDLPCLQSCGRLLVARCVNERFSRLRRMQQGDVVVVALQGPIVPTTGLYRLTDSGDMTPTPQCQACNG